jgi:hypothetical protein
LASFGVCSSTEGWLSVNYSLMKCFFRLVRNAQKQCLDDEIEHSNEEHRSAAMEYTPDAIQFSLISATEINTENGWFDICPQNFK